MMDEKKKLTDLVKYYVERYSMPVDGRASMSQYAEDGIAGYRRQLERILKNTNIGEQSLYDICIPKNSKVRRISISDFERYCFAEWYKYIKKLDDYDVIRLEEDYNRIVTENNRQYYTKLAESAIEAHNKALEKEDYDELRLHESDNEYSFNYPLYTETERSGLRMMIEAIFEVFYEPFDWKLFSEDVQNYPQETGFNPVITPEMMQSIERLKSIDSYAKKRKLPKK